ncbi:phage late control D family protein [Cellulosilyticum ruminicola]|uniref:phage late control D family protein n=1 Tax=Cellulosilyticum ruminicola TaxID=425254 RepID=UPI0006D14887|nr:hypothetical protein [Cellulosilyticum ruminicola]
MKSLMTGQTSYKALMQKYAGFQIPNVVIKVDGKSLSDAMLDSLEELNVSLTCKSHEMNVAAITFSPLKHEAIEDYFTLGQKIEIAVGYAKTEVVFTGYIYESEFKISEEEGWLVTIVCKDLMGILENKQDDTHHVGGNHIKEIRKILEDSTYRQYGKLAASQNKYLKELENLYAPLDKMGDFIQTHTTMTHLEKIRWIAQKHHYEFFVVGDEVYFRPSYSDSSSPIMTLSPNEGLMTLVVSQCIGKLIASSEIRGQDEETFEPIAGKKKRSIHAKVTKNKAAAATVLHYDEEIRKESEAKEISSAILDQNSWEVKSAQGQTIGIPELVPGRKVKIDGLGKGMNQVIYLRSVTHEISKSMGYHTYFEGGIKIDE